MRTYRNFSLNALWFLITVNVLVFMITLVDRDAVYSLFGLTPGDFLQQPWTIVTNLFVHGGFGHIMCNMISLYFLGSFLIRLIGEERFLIVYFLGGIAGNILFTLLAPSFTMGIGASGAIFALGGALAIIAPRLPVFMFFIPTPVPLWVAIIIFLLISFMPGIAWQAHLGGLLLGLGAGYYFKRKRAYFY
jgi:membrane associated rhomboid family serine protease